MNNLRVVKVTFEDGDTVISSMAAHLSNKEIHNYYKIGSKFNLGSVKDRLVAVKNVEILK